MSDYIIDASIDRETNRVCAVTVSTQSGQYVGRWEQPYADVTAHALNDKDEVRRIVNEVRAIRFHL
ncbi:hypothetical protein ACFVDI_13025 [Nocardioides sp. NPDC057767]|uniref:hypothetical protein n=1 Tax=unclassified Nocardioides TaxID=2615069 RepID=UPI00366D066C